MSDNWFVREDVQVGRHQINDVLSRFGMFALQELPAGEVSLVRGGVFLNGEQHEPAIREHLQATLRLQSLLEVGVKPLVSLRSGQGGVACGVQLLPVRQLKSHLDFFWKDAFSDGEVLRD